MCAIHYFRHCAKLSNDVIHEQGSFRMHYGMNIVLMNSLDEVLCVNQHHEVMCKSEDQLEYGDEICFRIVDLVEPTNPGPIAYGAPIWLQALNSEGDNNIYYGFVVGAKVSTQYPIGFIVCCIYSTKRKKEQHAN